MLYITGKHALNIPCSLQTCGDWHQPALKWENIDLRNSDDSIFGDYGIEHDKYIPYHQESFSIANHIRALLDLLEVGNFAIAQGMNNDYICNDEYDNEIFESVLRLKYTEHWNTIDRFMGKEYFSKWLNYKKGNQVG